MDNKSEVALWKALWGDCRSRLEPKLGDYKPYIKYVNSTTHITGQVMQVNMGKYIADHNTSKIAAALKFNTTILAKAEYCGYHLAKDSASTHDIIIYYLRSADMDNGAGSGRIYRQYNPSLMSRIVYGESAYKKVLTEAGIEVNHPGFTFLSEANQIQVTDEALTGMMKFITDKYNSLDFSEIEKSAGDINRFKYTDMIIENARILENIYVESADEGAKKYLEVVSSIQSIMAHLRERREMYITLYRSGNGVVQLLYTSMVAGCLYAIGTLVCNTIRFVTTEKDTPCEVLFDEIPGTMKHVHIKNVIAVANDLQSVNQVLNAFMKPENRTRMNEAVTLSAGTIAVLAIAGIILLIPKIIVLIREIIYSIYYSRVKMAEMLELQQDLLRTNIESLEAGRGNKKVIARQKKIAQKLETWKNRISLKMDSTEALKKTQERKENASLKIERNSPLASPEESTAGIML